MPGLNSHTTLGQATPAALQAMLRSFEDELRQHNDRIRHLLLERGKVERQLQVLLAAQQEKKQA